jgi:hypothetical protein
MAAMSETKHDPVEEPVLTAMRKIMSQLSAVRDDLAEIKAEIVLWRVIIPAMILLLFAYNQEWEEPGRANSTNIFWPAH